MGTYRTYKEPGQSSSLSIPFPSPSVPIRPLTIASLLRLWEKELESQVKPATYSVYTYQVERTLIPCLGSLPAREFGEKELKEFLEKLGRIEENTFSKDLISKDLKKGESQDTTRLSESSLYSLEIVLRRAFSYAVEQGLLEKNTLGRLRTRPCRDAQVEVLEKDSIKVLKGLLAMEEPKTRLEILLPLYTGCTLSELCALSWQEVDLAQKTIAIRKNLIRVKQTTNTANTADNTKMINTAETIPRITNTINSVNTADPAKTTNAVDIDTDKVINITKITNSTKTSTVKTVLQLTNLEPKKQRLIHIPPILCQELKEFLDEGYNSSQTDAEIKTMQHLVKDVSAFGSIYLLTGTTSYLEPRTYQKHVQATLSRCGIANGSLTMLRDTYAAMCLRCGAPEYSLARQMGVETGRLLERYEEFLREDYSFVGNLI